MANSGTSSAGTPEGQGDPHQEPENSTVDDWFGQDVERDAADAERALQEAGGDADRAEQLFEEHRRPHESEKFNVPAEDRPGGTDVDAGS